MTGLFDVPIRVIQQISPENSVRLIHALLHAELRYARLSPSELTISERLTVADGGIDAEIDATAAQQVPSDCLLTPNLIGYQIKSGASFCPWQEAAISNELVNPKGDLYPEVNRLISKDGHYALICTGHDLTPEQRNNAKKWVDKTLRKFFPNYRGEIKVLGAGQIKPYIERYPTVSRMLGVDPVQDALDISAWQRNSELARSFVTCQPQSELIAQIRDALDTSVNHIRIMGEPGLGKTRMVLEALRQPSYANLVLYYDSGARFEASSMFRHFLKEPPSKPMILVLDDTPEPDLNSFWGQLKPLCGQLRVITLDHGRDSATDNETLYLTAPALPAETIQAIIQAQAGESNYTNHWIEICEGSPRVAQAVGENLRANPEDLLKPPSTIAMWDRFLHGYAKRDNSNEQREVDCVAVFLALFARFGYEAPIADEANYIHSEIAKVEPSISLAKFQSIIQTLRQRRILQGKRTLFFVPKAFHIYLWRQFWRQHGRNFDFHAMFERMPPSLHVWFTSMFQYAEGTDSQRVIEAIVSSTGSYATKERLCSAQGARFVSILAEAHPSAVLKLLEATIGIWSDAELLDFKSDRQHIVWALEKIAVWTPYFSRAIKLVGRLAVNENSKNRNNATGILLGLFLVGPEHAATEASPEQRLPAFVTLLQSTQVAEKKLALNIAKHALSTSRFGFRIVGAEYQGLKPRANLWRPHVYDDWWNAYLGYFKAFLDESSTWTPEWASVIEATKLEIAKNQLTIPLTKDLALDVLKSLVQNSAFQRDELARFFSDWLRFERDSVAPETTQRIRQFQRQFVAISFADKFRRYVTQVDWMEWNEKIDNGSVQPRLRSKRLVEAVVNRIIKTPQLFEEVKTPLITKEYTPALGYFAEQLGRCDSELKLLPKLIEFAIDTQKCYCLNGYLHAAHQMRPSIMLDTAKQLMSAQKSAWLGVHIAFGNAYDHPLFETIKECLEKKWVEGDLLKGLQYSHFWNTAASQEKAKLIDLVNTSNHSSTHSILIELVGSLTLDDKAPVIPDFVFNLVCKEIEREEENVTDRIYTWKQVAAKLLVWQPKFTQPLLNALLVSMGNSNRFRHEHFSESLIAEIVQLEPTESWSTIAAYLEANSDEYLGYIMGMLRGGRLHFGVDQVKNSPISFIPNTAIMDWIEISPQKRAPLVADAAPHSLNDEYGGALTRELLTRFRDVDGVTGQIDMWLLTGSWTGLESAYLRGKREKLRTWLTQGFAAPVVQWIESSIEYLDKRIVDAETREERERY